MPEKQILFISRHTLLSYARASEYQWMASLQQLRDLLHVIPCCGKQKFIQQSIEDELTRLMTCSLLRSDLETLKRIRGYDEIHVMLHDDTSFVV